MTALRQQVGDIPTLPSTPVGREPGTVLAQFPEQRRKEIEDEDWAGLKWSEKAGRKERDPYSGSLHHSVPQTGYGGLRFSAEKLLVQWRESNLNHDGVKVLEGL